MPCNEEGLNTTVLIFLNKSWWSVGKEGTTLTCGHHSQVSVCREIFHWQWRKIEWNFPWRAETWEGCRLTPFDTLVNVVPFLFHRSSRVVLKKNGPLCKIPEKLPKRRVPHINFDDVLQVHGANLSAENVTGAWLWWVITLSFTIQIVGISYALLTYLFQRLWAFLTRLCELLKHWWELESFGNRSKK